MSMMTGRQAAVWLCPPVIVVCAEGQMSALELES